MILNESNINEYQFAQLMLDLAQERKSLRDVLFEEIGSELMAMKLHISKADLKASDKEFLSEQLMHTLNKLKQVSSALYPMELKELGVVNTLVRLSEYHFQLVDSLKVHAHVNDLDLFNQEEFFVLLNYLFIILKKMMGVEALLLVVDEINRLLIKVKLIPNELSKFNVDQMNLIQKQFQCLDMQFEWIAKQNELEIAISINERGN